MYKCFMQLQWRLDLSSFKKDTSNIKVVPITRALFSMSSQTI